MKILTNNQIIELAKSIHANQKSENIADRLFYQSSLKDLQKMLEISYRLIPSDETKKNLDWVENKLKTYKP